MKNPTDLLISMTHKLMVKNPEINEFKPLINYVQHHLPEHWEIYKGENLENQIIGLNIDNVYEWREHINTQLAEIDKTRCVSVIISTITNCCLCSKGTAQFMRYGKNKELDACFECVNKFNLWKAI